MQTLMPLADTDRTECGSKPVQVFMFCTRFVIVPSVSKPAVQSQLCGARPLRESKSCRKSSWISTGRPRNLALAHAAGSVGRALMNFPP